MERCLGLVWLRVSDRHEAVSRFAWPNMKGRTISKSRIRIKFKTSNLIVLTIMGWFVPLV
jgi:hypothetical protein